MAGQQHPPRGHTISVQWIHPSWLRTSHWTVVFARSLGRGRLARHRARPLLALQVLLEKSVGQCPRHASHRKTTRLQVVGFVTHPTTSVHGIPGCSVFVLQYDVRPYICCARVRSQVRYYTQYEHFERLKLSSLFAARSFHAWLPIPFCELS